MIAKRKFGLYGMIAAAHGIMIWFYQIPFPNPANIKQPFPASPVIMAAGTKWDATLQDHPLTRDPLLLARAHEKGFTGGLWNKSFKSPNPYNDWNESPRYLGAPELKWGSAFNEFVNTETLSLWKPLTKPASKLEPTETHLQNFSWNSTFQFSPNLNARAPSQLPELPLWKGPEPLPPTRMQIGVQPTGMIQSVRLINPEVSDSIEREFVQKAVRITKKIKFQSNHNSPSSVTDKLQWGELEIQWQQAVPGLNQETNLNQKGEVR